jgi:hypothetical protein
MCRYLLMLFCLSFFLANSALGDDDLPVLTPGIINKRYIEQIHMTVGGAAPFTYALGGDDKPAGLSINPENGLLQSVLTKAALGTHRLHAVVTDYTGKQTTQDFLLHVTASVMPSASHAAVLPPPPPPSPPSKPSPPTTMSGSPSITSATSGLSTVYITSPDFPSGAASATYKVYALDPAMTCSAGKGQQLDLAPESKAEAKRSAATPLRLAYRGGSQCI